MKKYYLPYDEKEEANYVYVLMFYSLASYNPLTKRYDVITYTSIKNLLDQLNKVSQKNISESTVRRILSNRVYEKFFQVEQDKKSITLKNDIRESKKFIVLSDREAKMIMDRGENLLATYYIYLKYYCGYSRSKTVDTTAKQVLDACGYSTKSNSYISKLSEYNSFLSEEGFITISKFKDMNGFERNCYRCS